MLGAETGAFGLTPSIPTTRLCVPENGAWRRSAAARGGVAQLGERLNGIQEVRGSIPLASMAGHPGRGFAPSLGSPGDGVVAGIAQLVEHNLAKVGVAGSSPVSRSLENGGAPGLDGVASRCQPARRRPGG